MGMIMKDGVPYGGVYPIDDVPTQGSDNTVKSGGVFSAIEPLPAIQNILGAKNIFTGWDAESNKILIAISDCTPATSYIFSYDELSTRLEYRLYFVNSSGTITEVTNGWTTLSNPLSFTTNSDTVQVTFRVKYFYDSAISPSDISSTMIRPAGTDATYASYAKTNKQLTDDVATNAEAIAAIVNKNGCCNMLPNNASTSTVHGATLTVNADKTVTIKRVTPDGSWVIFQLSENVLIKAGTYTFTSLYSGSEKENVYLVITDMNDATLVKTEGVESIDYAFPNDKVVKFYVTIKPNAAISTPITFKPMLYDYRLKPSGYVPYSMTNRELTEMLAPPSSIVCYGTAMYIVSLDKWSIFIPLDVSIIRNCNITASNVQIVAVTMLTYSGIQTRHNGICVVVDEDLSSYVNREGYAILTLTPKS